LILKFTATNIIPTSPNPSKGGEKDLVEREFVKLNKTFKIKLYFINQPFNPYIPLLWSNGTNIGFYLYFLYAPVFVILGNFLPGLLRIMFFAILLISFSISTSRPFIVNSTFSVNIKFLIILKEFLNDISFGGKSSFVN